MALWKALAADRKSSHGFGNDFGPWVTGQWYEVNGPIHWDVHGNQPPNRPINGFFCSDDIIYCQYPVLTQYVAQVEVDGDSIIYENTQCWQKMRVVSVKAWPASKSTLVLDWAEGQCHDLWAGYFVSEGAVYDMAHYQGQFGTMLNVIEPLWKSLFTRGDEIYGLKPKFGVNTRLPQYSNGLEQTMRLAYALALCLTGSLTLLGSASWVRRASSLRPAAWDIVRGNAEDHWETLPEVE